MVSPPLRTRWGGLADSSFSKRGYFGIGERHGIFWLIDPDGGRFLSKGVNTVRLDQDRTQDGRRIPYAEACARKFRNQDAWRACVAGRLAGWGFNTLGAWSDEAVAKASAVPLARTPILDLGMSFAGDRNGTLRHRSAQSFPDVFSEDFARHSRERAGTLCGPASKDEGILGWFVDNELSWGPDWRGSDELLTIFLSLPHPSPGRFAAFEWLRSRYPDFEQFTAIWRAPAASWHALAGLGRVEPPYRRKPSYERSTAGEAAPNRADSRRAAFAADCDAFAALVAERYFAVTGAAIRAADPHHLLLGCRFAYPPAPGVVDAAARHVDVISFNCYERDPAVAIDGYAAAGKPCLIGEFSFRSMDSGLPNTNGAGPIVATQADRASCLRRYVAAAACRPSLVGYHWFEHADQPIEGRFDGENSNFGLVTIADDVYPDVTEAMTAVNAAADERHTAARAGAAA